MCQACRSLAYPPIVTQNTCCAQRNIMNAATTKPLQPCRTIRLAVRTGTHLLAGTDAPVWVQLVGALRRTQWILLQPENGGFERASTEHFKLRFAPAVDPGEIEVVNVQVRPSGPLDGWSLEYIKVDERPHHFDAWLALDEPPYRLDASSVRDDDARAYDLVVQTSDAFLAGTDSPVYLQLVGTRTTTPWIRLHEPENRAFRTGKLDHFREWSEDVGVVVGAWLRHDNEGVAAGWRLDWLDVDGRRLNFDRWLAIDEGDHRLDAFVRHRPWLKVARPMQVSLTTFSDIRARAEAALQEDIRHANRLFNRYGISIERADSKHDVIFDEEKWITFQARHAETEALAEELVRLRAQRVPRTHHRVVPVFYIGGFEQETGRYANVSRQAWGVFRSFQQHAAPALAHELGRFFGLHATTGTGEEDTPTDAIRVDVNPHDLLEGDRHNVMSNSTLPIDLLGFTNGQIEAMVLGLMRYVS